MDAIAGVILALVALNIVLVAVIFVYVPLPHPRTKQKLHLIHPPARGTTPPTPGAPLSSVIIF